MTVLVKPIPGQLFANPGWCVKDQLPVQAGIKSHFWPSRRASFAAFNRANQGGSATPYVPSGQPGPVYNGEYSQCGALTGGYDSSLALAQDYTLIAICSRPTGSGRAIAIGRGNPVGAEFEGLFVNAGVLQISHRGSTVVATGTNSLTHQAVTNEPTFFAVTVAGTAFALYSGNRLTGASLISASGTFTSATAASTKPLQYPQKDGVSPFNDPLRMYGVASYDGSLSLAQLQSIFDTQKARLTRFGVVGLG